MKKKLPKSVRKYIRREKARIRREVLDLNEQEKLINQLYERFLNKPQKPQINNKTIKKNQEKSKKSKPKSKKINSATDQSVVSKRK